MAHANDNFADAIELFGESGAASPVTIDPSNADTLEPGEPQYGTGETLWWKWTCPTTGGYTFTTYPSPSSRPEDWSIEGGLDTKIQIFDSDPFTNDAIVWNDDLVDDPVARYWNSRVEFNAVAGTTYYIQIDMYGDGEAGTLNLSWEGLPPPPPGPPPQVPGLLRVLWNGTQLYLRNTDPSYMAQPDYLTVQVRITWGPGASTLQWDTLEYWIPSHASSNELVIEPLNPENVMDLRNIQVTINGVAQPISAPAGRRWAFGAPNVTTVYFGYGRNTGFANAWTINTQVYSGETGTVDLVPPTLYALGADISRSTTDGETFTDIETTASQSGRPYRGFVDGWNRIVIFDFNRQVYSWSTDGGVTWVDNPVSMPTAPSGLWYDAGYVNVKYVLASTNAVATTSSFGASWVTGTLSSASAISMPKYIADKWIATGWSNTTYRAYMWSTTTTNGSGAWTRGTAWPMPSTFAYGDVHALSGGWDFTVHPTNNQKMVSVGYWSNFVSNNDLGVIYRTTNGGTTWTYNTLPAPMSADRVLYLNSGRLVCLARADAGILHTSGSLLLYSDDDGVTWSTSSLSNLPDTFAGYYMTDVTHDNAIYVWGHKETLKSRIWRTYDGASWELVHNDINGSLIDDVFTAPGVARLYVAASSPVTAGLRKPPSQRNPESFKYLQGRAIRSMLPGSMGGKVTNAALTGDAGSATAGIVSGGATPITQLLFSFANTLVQGSVSHPVVVEDLSLNVTSAYLTLGTASTGTTVVTLTANGTTFATVTIPAGETQKTAVISKLLSQNDVVRAVLTTVTGSAAQHLTVQVTT